MAKQKLKELLDKHQGVDLKLKKQKLLQKQAERRKKQQRQNAIDPEVLETAAGAEEIAESRAVNGKKFAKAEKVNGTKSKRVAQEEETNGWETDESENAESGDEDEDDEEEEGGVDLEALLEDSESESEDEQLFAMDEDAAPSDDDNASDIPLSDIESLASEDRADIIPHQRLTINNTAALQRSLKSFALSSKLPFSATIAVTSTAPVEIDDVENDLTRETAFYEQCLQAAREGRIRLKKDGVAFTRPTDYFAEMVKSEEQMGKVRSKMLDEAARKKASAAAKAQREAKKFGKEMQRAVDEGRKKETRDLKDKINILKRKRSGAELSATNEDDPFDVALEDAAETEKKDRAKRKAQGGKGEGLSAGARKAKRQRKDEKYGMGGKKKYKKSNDAESTSDLKGYSARRMKSGGSKTQRPGKSRRAAGKR